MPYAMHDKEYANVVALRDVDRYAYACAKFVDWREVWSLRNAGGWVLAGDDDGREGVPVWPHPRFAQDCATGRWDGCVPAAIPVQDWMDKWLPGMERDNRYVATFPLPGASTRAIQVEPAAHREHLSDELAKYGEDGDADEA
ncbi:MAG TPA: DUF2750 domain-containing protein [Tepidisphaeraceae bacterium]|nr:DUF2750 domain-containing protein [Tepidisphaeraceae bacterium]